MDGRRTGAARPVSRPPARSGGAGAGPRRASTRERAGERVLLRSGGTSRAASPSPRATSAPCPNRGSRARRSGARARTAPHPSRTPRARRRPARRPGAPAPARGTARIDRARRASACWPAAHSARPRRRRCRSAAGRRRPVATRAIDASPARWSAANRKSPDASPVNTRPVRLPPCAAGARPRRRIRAAGSPKPGTGRPQYGLVAEPRDLVPRDLLAPRDEARAAPGRRLISSVRAASAATRSGGAATATSAAACRAAATRPAGR